MKLSRFTLIVGLLLCGVAGASAQLRICSYNIAHLGGDQNALQAVFAGAMADDKFGFFVPPHIFVCSEVNTTQPATVVARLNAAAAPFGVTYVAGTYTGSSTEDSASGAEAIFYRSDALTEDVTGHLDIATGASRNTDRWKFTLNGYSSPQVVFYVYSAHLKSGTATSDMTTRTNGATAIRANADTLGAGVHILYCGDWNIYHSTESAYQVFIAAGNGQAVDPYGNSDWAGSGGAIKHTQSPILSNPAHPSLTTGGMDDRFDLQLGTNAFNDGQGLSRIAGTYHTLGNDGNHYNMNINDGNNSYYPADIPRSNALATNLWNASDHCPVICDYQIPAKMAATLPGSYGRVVQGATVTLNLQVSNTASAIVASGADQLPFTGSGTGVLASNSPSGTAFVLSAPVDRTISVSTAAVGSGGGTLTVSTTRQGAQNSTINLNVNGTVVSHANASFDSGSDLDAIDLTPTFDADTGVQTFTADVYNFGFTSDQSLLDLDGVSGLAAPFAFVGGLQTGIGAGSATLTFSIDTTGLTAGTYPATATITTSDEDILGETSADITANITVTINAAGCNPPKIGDIDGNCVVDLSDLSIQLSHYGTSVTPNTDGDLDGNGIVDLADLSILLSHYGT